MLKGNVEILELSSYCFDRIWMYLIAHVIFVPVFIKSTVSTLMEHHLIIHSVSLVHYLWCGDLVRKDLKVKYFPFCLLWQNLIELPFLETKRCLYGFYWVHQVCTFECFIDDIICENNIGIRCAKNGTSAGCQCFLESRRERRRVRGSCLFAGHLLVFLPVLRNSLLNLSYSSPTPR